MITLELYNFTSRLTKQIPCLDDSPYQASVLYNLYAYDTTNAFMKLDL
jgi:hypothetical protein